MTTCRRRRRAIRTGSKAAPLAAGRCRRVDTTLGREGRRDGRDERRALAGLDQPPVQARRPLGLPAARPATVPHVGGDPAANPIDAFLVAKLGQQGLQPAPPADRRTLIRRATFDLTGLPPTPEEVDAFVRRRRARRLRDGWSTGCSPRPHYGERWGRHWLDVARYADTDGLRQRLRRPQRLALPRLRRSARSTSDKPYDRFVREQLAGDELDPGRPRARWSPPASCGIGPWELTGDGRGRRSPGRRTSTT